MLPFDEAWARTDPIEGWLNKDEAELLYSLACTIPPNQSIIEIGSYRGRSTTLLACSGRQVMAIDLFEIGYQVAQDALSEIDVDIFKRQIKPLRNVTWQRQRAETCSPPDLRAGLVFIDGNHVYPHPLNDFNAVLPWCSERAVFAFHDYDSAPGVTQSVAELRGDNRIIGIGRAGSLIAVSSTPIT